jgi:uncharacterized protein
MSSLTAARLIQLLNLEPLPIEGGFFRQTYLAPETFEPSTPSSRTPGPRSACSAIYYLLHGDNFSALHRLKTDELYHFYLGDPVELLLLYPDGSTQHPILGPDLEAGQYLQFLLPQGVWQGSQLLPGGSFGLLGTTMAPAYTQDDFELGQRDTLIQLYPSQAKRITQLTR